MQSRQEVEYRGSRESVDDKRKESKEEKLTNKMPVELEGAASGKIKGIGTF
jgi:hypothetical protein